MRGLSTAAAKDAAFGRDDGLLLVGGECDCEIDIDGAWPSHRTATHHQGVYFTVIVPLTDGPLVQPGAVTV